ncbi:hypothetical protein MPTK1_6g19390 [Marchantia polymorpha subsp. ruderalis]|uniref:Uncharacterized protein n=2 Tax=Marchantia polymorpha TaxID=3197 RepID=A0AAF6BTS4_MARPO|nr:hypothetical protein MARPO_0045s0124 [Marchantia polymorpha]BBN15408.1 hypothetical protein Mp_6g19390 [Marchantia polymorpha subsp. ruderalis]|eukprot:PTQ39480.1 hypothetical protein MARPO_0045s0124 [Marchantia polymorpha]
MGTCVPRGRSRRQATVEERAGGNGETRLGLPFRKWWSSCSNILEGTGQSRHISARHILERARTYERHFKHARDYYGR